MIKSSIKKNSQRTNKVNRPKHRSSHHTDKGQGMIVVGMIEHHQGRDVVRVDGNRYPLRTRVDNKQSPPLGALVKARLHQAGNGMFSATVISVIGKKQSLKERIESLLKDLEVRQEFPPAVLQEAEQYPAKVLPKHKAGRTDLTELSLCTIDGESAKDFDDAVFAQEKGKNIEVIVAIADVSAYVQEGSALDEEAFLRATSIYYPGSCIPMLPESLSNGLCSLKPNVLRLALAVSFEVGPKGAITKPKIVEAVIKSAARLTYNQVQKFYDTKKSNFDNEVQQSLLMLQKAARILRKNRELRGAIDFDIVESVVALDDIGEPIAIHPQDRLDSHRIIEDLMVATNEVVASFFEKKKWPCVYRVHESPDQEKLANFFRSAQAFQALEGKAKISHSQVQEPKDLQKIMAAYQKSKYAAILNNLMLRAMMQARYSEENLMHFGLASSAYLHFTSPIRRYADLMVHRQLRYLLFEKNAKKKISLTLMQKVSSTISDKEAKATDLERKIDRLFASTFMASRVGDSFEAIIVSCTEFGMFVRILEHHVEGLVHISTISRHHVQFIPDRMALIVSGSKESYMVGDTIHVRLKNVNIERGHVDFELIKKSPNEQSIRPHKRRKRRE